MVILNKFTFLTYKALYPYQSLKSFVIFRILDPIIHYIFFATLVSAVLGGEYLKYIVIGNVVFYTSQTMIINFMNMFRGERIYGTLELNIASPTPTFILIIRKSIVPIIDSLFVFLISLLSTKLMFNLSLPVTEVRNLLIITVTMIFSIFSFSLLFACLSLIFSNINLILNITLAILQIFCGVNYPVTILPDALESFSRILPLTHSIEAFRLIYMHETNSIYFLLFKEFIIGFCYLFMAIIFVSLMEKLARRNGSLFKNI